MQNKKPNQVIDEITKVIYPPAEAIVDQLGTIRAIVTPTIKLYENTGDIHTIQPNLDMIERAIKYLRGAPYIDIPLDKEPEDTLNPTFITPDGMGAKIELADEDNSFLVSLINFAAKQEEVNEDLFGEIDFDAMEIHLEIPIECGKPYIVTQYNPVLEHFNHDPSISQDSSGKWCKIKEYVIDDEDTFEYAFLIPTGRSEIEIYIDDDAGKSVGKFKIVSHIHFEKEKEDNG